jgi:hypothetical protein
MRTRLRKPSRKRKNLEPKAQENLSKDQGEKDERRKKKKHEEKRPVVTVREKSAIKKTKVHKALKIHTSSESGEISKPKETQAQEKEVLVEKDQDTNAKGDDVSGAKEGPLPQPESLVEDHHINDEGKQDDVHRDRTILEQGAPNAEKKENDSLANSEGKDKEVNFVLFLNSIF